MFVDRPVGIDLGTTNSEIALLHPSERELLIYADRFGRKTIPSAVAWDSKAECFLIGHAARARRDKTPAPIESIKRKMGQRAAVDCGPHALSPEDVSAKILGELRDRMREHLAAQAAPGVEMRVARAVVTVPAYFDAPQVEATRKAGELAGLDVIGILQEPTAAAIYHTWKSRLHDGHFLVYDLGGGTFDVTVLRCIAGEYQVLAIDGDNYLGGDDLDRRFAEWIRGELVKRGYALELDVRGDDADRRRFGRLVHLAQEIKESLSTSDVVSVSKQDVVDDKQGEPVSYDAEIGRDAYEKIVGDLVEKTFACAERALARSKEVASIGIAEIDHVVLVGGSTRVPLVVRKVTELFCRQSRSEKPLQDDVDTCVALGAAVHAAQLGGLRLGDEAARTTVLLTTPLVAQAPKIRVGVRVEAAPEATREVTMALGDAVVARAAIERVPSEVVRMEVPLEDKPANEGTESAEYLATLEMRAASGEKLSELPFALYRGDVRPRASSLSRASVVAKDIAIDVLRSGRRERRVLLARGTGLPAEATARFFTADQSGAVVLRLLQNRLPIKTLLLEVPQALAIGTPVDVTLKCDEAMRIEARALVAGQELWAQVEAPTLARFDPRGAVDALLEEAENAGRALWGGLGASYRREADALVAAIRELTAIDPDKVEALCQQLRILIDEVRGGPNEDLAPPMHRFEETLDALRRIVYRAQATLVGMDRGGWEKTISDIEERARAAHDANDGPAWRRAFNEVQALLETAHQEEFATMRLEDPAYVSRRIANVIAWANRVETSLADIVPPASEEVRAMQAKERDRLSAWLREKVSEPLSKMEKVHEGGETPSDGAPVAFHKTDAGTKAAAATRQQLSSISAELERIEAAVERIPSLGLVTDRGAV